MAAVFLTSVGTTGYIDCNGDGTGTDTDGCEFDDTVSKLGSCPCAAKCGSLGACTSRCASLITNQHLNFTCHADKNHSCEGVCDASHSDCNGDGSGSDDDGCETVGVCTCDSLCTDGVAGSAACNARCEGSASNSNWTCSGQTCSLNGCDEGFKDCDFDSSNGCEYTLLEGETECPCSVTCASDLACGAYCDKATGHAIYFNCTASVCKATCDVNYLDCDGDLSNGCETFDVNQDGKCYCEAQCTSDENCIDNCPLVTANGIANVTNYTCVIASGATYGVCAVVCADGSLNCDNGFANGCEYTLGENETSCPCSANCGVSTDACNANCDAAANHLIYECDGQTGQCNNTGCVVGFDECDGNMTNGCEYVLQEGETSCPCTATCATDGACTANCISMNQTYTCVAGECVAACAAGYGDCDNNAANGCETILATGETECPCSFSCGTDAAICDANCNATATNADSYSCTDGACVANCTTGFLDCDADKTDCEYTIPTGGAATCPTVSSDVASPQGSVSSSNGPTSPQTPGPVDVGAAPTVVASVAVLVLALLLC